MIPTRSVPPATRCEHVSGVVQLPAIQIFREALKGILALHRVNQGDQSRETGAGDTGIGEGDPPLKSGESRSLPAGDLFRFDQLGIVDEDDRQGGKGCPQAFLIPEPAPGYTGPGKRCRG